MGEKERDIINRRLANLKPSERLFRINSGMGWQGKSVRKGSIIIIKNPRPLYAAPQGWPDLCGWKTIVITPDMIGKKIAIFTAEEVKVTGKLSPEQERFRDIIVRMGGVFRVVN